MLFEILSERCLLLIGCGTIHILVEQVLYRLEFIGVLEFIDSFILSFIFFPPSLFCSVLFHDVHISLSDFESGSGEILSEIIGSTSRYLHDFIGSIAFYLLHAEYLLLQGRELRHYLLDEVYLVPLLCPPVFLGTSITLSVVKFRSSCRHWS